jgi:general secretion pathway protein A
LRLRQFALNLRTPEEIPTSGEKLMFSEFYQLREQPFGVTPDPRFLYFGATHREALASLLYAMQEKRGFSAMVAQPGMGKTSLLFRMLGTLGNSARTAFLFQTDGDTRDLLHSLLADFGVSSSGMDLVGMREALHGILLQELNAGRPVVVVIDEAQHLDDNSLESVRMLSNFETSSQKLMHIVLAGQPSLAAKLAADRLVQLRQRIASIIRLEPFGRQETESYIQHRLRAAGHSGAPIFAPEAYEMIARASQGIPRNINSLCFQALSLGCALKAQRIGLDILREVLSDSDFTARPAPRTIEPPVVQSETYQRAAKVEAPRAWQKPHAPPTPQAAKAAPRRLASTAVPRIPELVAPSRSGSQWVKWIGIPALAAIAVFAVIFVGTAGFELDSALVPRLYDGAKDAISNARGQGLSSESKTATGPQPAAPPRAPVYDSKEATQQPATVGSEALVPATVKEASAKTADDPAPQPTTIVTPRRMTAVDIARIYLGQTDWHTLYKLLALNPEIGWSQQDIPKGTRVVLPRAVSGGVAVENSPASASRSNRDPARALPGAIPAALPETRRGPALVEVKHSESIFQLALENYGRSSWVIVREICKANPQLDGVYDVLHEGELVRLPDPATFPTKHDSRSKSRQRQ